MKRVILLNTDRGTAHDPYHAALPESFQERAKEALAGELLPQKTELPESIEYEVAFAVIIAALDLSALRIIYLFESATKNSVCVTDTVDVARRLARRHLKRAIFGISTRQLLCQSCDIPSGFRAGLNSTVELYHQ